MNKFAHGHADNFAVGLLCEMAGYGVPVVVVPHCKPQLASHPAFAASLETLRGMGVRVLFDPDAPYERRLPPWGEVVAALPAGGRAGGVMTRHAGRADRAGAAAARPIAGRPCRAGRPVGVLAVTGGAGKRGVDSHAVLTRLAAVLRVEVEELTGPDGSAEEGQRVTAGRADRAGHDAL